MTKVQMELSTAPRWRQTWVPGRVWGLVFRTHLSRAMAVME